MAPIGTSGRARSFLPAALVGCSGAPSRRRADPGAFVRRRSSAPSA